MSWERAGEEPAFFVGGVSSEAPEGGVDGEGEGDGEVVVGAGVRLAESGEFLFELGVEGEVGWDHEEAALEDHTERREEMLARDEVGAVVGAAGLEA